MTSEFLADRKIFHQALLASILTVDSSGVASNADRGNRLSVDIALGIANQLQSETIGVRLAGQTAGNKFEDICAKYIQGSFSKLNHMRPGNWDVHQVIGRRRLEIAEYEQYAHLIALDRAASNDPELAAALGSDYTISPDIVIVRETEPDATINRHNFLVDEKISKYASIRKANGGKPLLHASISCKWTIRSDRSQNSRSEALNLIRNRKGRLPHIVVVTGEPLPSRLASIALGTGDIDCVYHFALHELQATIQLQGKQDAEEMLSIMIKGKRLKDISDLPLDLVT